MPIYTFRCSFCQLEVDMQFKVKDRDSLVHCESCGLAMDRKISRVAAVYEPTNTQIRFDNKLAKNRKDAERRGY